MTEECSIVMESASLTIPVFDYGSQKLTRALKWRKERNGHARTYVQALRDISLKLSENSRLAVFGDNGSGKTTLLKLIAGIYSPSSGKVSVAGRVASLLDISLGIEPDLTGRESIYARGDLLGISRKRLTALEDEIVDFADIGEAIDLPTRTYSSGMQVRLGFGISTSVSPDILLMDEWLSVGDQNFRAKATKRLSELIGSSRILVLATHSRELAERVTEEAIWLENGEIRERGKTPEVAAKYFERK